MESPTLDGPFSFDHSDINPDHFKSELLPVCGFRLEFGAGSNEDDKMSVLDINRVALTV